MCCLIVDLINQPEKNFGPGQSIGLVKQDLEDSKSRGNRNPCGLSPKNRKNMGLLAHRIDINHA